MVPRHPPCALSSLILSTLFFLRNCYFYYTLFLFFPICSFQGSVFTLFGFTLALRLPCGTPKPNHPTSQPAYADAKPRANSPWPADSFRNPRNRNHAWGLTPSRVSYILQSTCADVKPTLVGSSGLEPPTSRLSGARSNQLSYEPVRLNCP